MAYFDMSNSNVLGGLVTEATATTFRIVNTGSNEALIFTGTFTYGNGNETYPTAGAITQVQFADGEGNVGITVTENLPDWSELQTQVLGPWQALVASISWSGVVHISDDAVVGEPTSTSIVFENFDGTRTEFVGTFDIANFPNGSVTAINLLIPDPGMAGNFIIDDTVTVDQSLASVLAAFVPTSDFAWLAFAGVLFEGDNSITTATGSQVNVNGFGGIDDYTINGDQAFYQFTGQPIGVIVDLVDGTVTTADGVENIPANGLGQIIGSDHDDEINGGDANDTLNGGNGNDIINGGGEADNIFGEMGDDVINGGADNDYLTGDEFGLGEGEGGADTFVFDTTLESQYSAGFGSDVVLDFQTDRDAITILRAEGSGLSFEDLTITDHSVEMEGFPPSVWVQIDVVGRGTIILQGITSEQLTEEMFTFQDVEGPPPPSGPAFFDMADNTVLGGEIILATDETLIIYNGDDDTQLIFHGDFTYGPEPDTLPISGAITSVQVANGAGRVGVTITDNLPDWSVIQSEVIAPLTAIADDIPWIDVIDPLIGEPVEFSNTSIILLNLDGTFTEIAGTFANLDGDGAPTGIVTELRHLQADPANPGSYIEIDSVAPDIDIALLIAALFPSSGEAWRLFAGTLFGGDNTILTHGTEDADFYWLSGYGGVDTYLTNGDGNNGLSFRNEESAVTVDLEAGTAITADGTEFFGRQNLAVLAAGLAGAAALIPNVGVVEGSSFADTLLGRDHADNGDALFGADGNDTISGRAGNDVLMGGMGNDTLDGGAGADLLVGTYMPDEGEEANTSGVDTVTYASAAAAITLNLADTSLNRGDAAGDEYFFIDRFVGSNHADRMTGDSGNNHFDGGAGNDILDGNGGIDTLIGGLGNDTYFTDGQDRITEGVNGGTDLVISSVNYLLALNVENLTLVGTAITGTGNALANVITGNASNNILNGGDGNDTMSGAAGNDTMQGGNGNDRLLGDAGDDLIRGGAGSDVMFGGIGNDRVYGDAGIDTIYGGDGRDSIYGGADGDRLYGDAGDDTIYGDAGNDLLGGGDGNDTLLGGDGTDSITGGAGIDVITGGLGRDVINGGLGADRFVYTSTGESTVTQRDLLQAFERGIDDIDLRLIDANTRLAGNQAFVFIGTAAFDGTAGQLRYVTGGAIVRVEGDVNGDGRADFAIEVGGNGALTAGDFIL